MAENEDSGLDILPENNKLSRAGEGDGQTPLEKDGSYPLPSVGIEMGEVQISAADVKEAPSPPEASSRVMASGEWKPGDTVLKDYRVERELGKGGMGMVYLVRSLSTGERFAVKRVIVQSDATRRNFVSELQTWIDLPDHPNLAACRFFRSVGDEIVIFAEYLEGGSLDRWIMNGHGPLYEGEPDDVLARILDIAVQSAWGLHALHEWGLTHQDMKPGNVLLTAGSGQVKVCDFGIARSRSTGESLAGGDLGTSYAKYGGRTNAFCSPEQKEGRPLSRKTDVWSWGLSVLQMFTGTVCWDWGDQAEQGLRSTLQSGGRDSRVPRMPPQVAEILDKCFHKDPTRRWGSLFEAAEVLRKVLAERMAESFLPPVPAFPRKAKLPQPDLESRTCKGGVWKDPRLLLRKAFEAADLDATDLEVELPPRTGSRQAQGISDVAAYKEVVQLLLRFIASGAKSLEPALARTYADKAFVHEFLSDLPGALHCYDQALEIHERLVKMEGSGVLSDELARTYRNKANALCSLGELEPAIALYDRAIEIYERLVKEEKRWELADELARTYRDKANALCSLGEFKLAIALCDQAIEIYERMVKEEGRWELAGELARTYSNKAEALCTLRENKPALTLYKQAIKIMEGLVREEGRWELANDLANTYQKKGTAYYDQGYLGGAIASYDLAIAIMEGLVKEEGRWELANDLANTYQKKAYVQCEQQQQFSDPSHERERVIATFDQAIAMMERLVKKEGRRELASNQARIYMNKAVSLDSIGELKPAIALYDQAIEIYERLVKVEGRWDLAGSLANTYENKSEVLARLGEPKLAEALLAQAMEIGFRLFEAGRTEFWHDQACLKEGKT